MNFKKKNYVMLPVKNKVFYNRETDDNLEGEIDPLYLAELEKLPPNVKHALMLARRKGNHHSSFFYVL